MRVTHLKVVLLVLVLFLSACGYKPSAKYARNVLGEKVSTSVVISAADPENSVLVKDAVDVAVVDTFHASLVDRAHSQTHLEIRVSNPRYSPIQYDANGFVIAYRMKISLNVKAYKNGEEKKYKTSGFYDFAVEPNAIVTDQQRFEAIRYAAQKALSALIAKISADGSRNK
jgi:outer membrane lipopolysaccharide assembly protein LptE/RlpB